MNLVRFYQKKRILAFSRKSKDHSVMKTVYTKFLNLLMRKV